MKNNKLLSTIIVFHRLYQLCILLIIISLCSIANAQTGSQVVLDSPDDGTELNMDNLWEFSWTAPAFEIFKVEFSTNEQFKTTVHQVSSKSSSIVLKQEARKKLIRIALKNDDILFWRVVAKNNNDKAYSGHRFFMIEKRYPKAGQLMGFVFEPVDPESNKRSIPIAGARVYLFDSPDTGTIPVAETATSQSGKYVFENLPFGDYIMVVEKEGYTPAREEVTVEEPDPSSQNIITRFNIGLYPYLETEALWGGVNNGDIFDEDGPVIDEMLDQLARANLRVLRVIIDYRLEMDEDGNPLPMDDDGTNGLYNDCILNWIDRLMVKAREKGILLLIALQVHNWIKDIDGEIIISKENYEWRKCKTPYNVYLKALSDGPQDLSGPYAERGWSDNFLTSTAAKNAYKARVYHILNHYNHFLEKKWKDIDDVVWAWALQGELEHLPNSPVDVLRDWLNEMATYVKSIDPGTYVASGTMHYDENLGDIKDVDIYTVHPYWKEADLLSDLDGMIKDFKDEIGDPYGKLLLIQEFNPFWLARPIHTPDNRDRKPLFEYIMEVCRKNNVPWMFWEHGYYFDDDDIWHANGERIDEGIEVEHFDGVFWGAKVLPGAEKIWQTSWDWGSTGKPWKVHKMVDNICYANPACGDTGNHFFIDTFSGGTLSDEYTIYDEGTEDSYFITTGSSHEYGYLRIEADKWQDLWSTPEKTGAPLVLFDAPVLDDPFSELYSVETFVSADPLLHVTGFASSYSIVLPLQTLNTQMGLFVFQDFDNWIFFGLTNHDFTSGSRRIQGDGLIITVTRNGVSSIVAVNPIEEDYVFLKIEHRADLWRFSWKLENGEPWIYWWTISGVFFKDHKVGLGLKTLDLFPQPTSPGHANFDYFLINEKRRR